MNSQVWDYYKKTRGLHDILLLTEGKLTWEEAKKRAPCLIKGWFELSLLSTQDRIEFTKDFWLKTLPFIPQAHSNIASFFDRLEDIGVFLFQEKIGNPYLAEIVYSLKEGSVFFRGKIPCTHEDIHFFQQSFTNLLPRDYFAFLRIHNGFAKTSDTGMLSLQDIPLAKESMQAVIYEGEGAVFCDGKEIDPAALIPFYESFGRHSYQCFYTEWYPTSEMGNVYFSSQDFTISRYTLPNLHETMAFTTFLQWLVFYLEGIECI